MTPVASVRLGAAALRIALALLNGLLRVLSNSALASRSDGQAPRRLLT
jgi:hypothetical protein